MFLLALTLSSACAVAEPPPPAITPVATGVRLVSDGGPLAALTAERVAMAAEDRAEASGVSAELAGGVPLTLRADRSSWDLKTRQVLFEGAVVAERGPFRLTCDRLQVEADAAGAPRRALASGAVRVTREGWTAESAEAELRLPEGVLTLTGQPKVSDGRSELSGARVVLHMDEERIECEGCTLVLPDPLKLAEP